MGNPKEVHEQIRFELPLYKAQCPLLPCFFLEHRCSQLHFDTLLDLFQL